MSLKGQLSKDLGIAVRIKDSWKGNFQSDSAECCLKMHKGTVPVVFQDMVNVTSLKGDGINF